jgi:NADH-quinone oxidoreductase subunit M
MLLYIVALPFLAMVAQALLPDNAAGKSKLQSQVHTGFSMAWGLLTAWVGYVALMSPEGLVLEWPHLALAGGSLDFAPRLSLNGASSVFVMLLGLAQIVVYGLLHDNKGAYGRSYAIPAHLLAGSLAGLFVSDSLLLFYLFWELALIGAYFWIGLHGRPSFFSGSVYSTLMRFVLLTLAGSLPMLASIAAICGNEGSDPGLSGLAGAVADLSPTTQNWVFLGFLLGVAVKLPMLGLHGWLRDTYSVAPPACRAMLSGVMSKMGAFGLIFVVAQGFPEQCYQYGAYLQMWAVLGVVYGAAVCLAQDRLVDILAYSSLSHLGILALGVFASVKSGITTTTGYTGSLLLVFNHGLIMAFLFALDARVMKSEESADIGLLSGLRFGQRRLAALFLVGIFASASLPGLSNFAGEILVYFAAFKSSPWLTFLAAVGALIGAGALMRGYHKAFLGKQPAIAKPGYEQAPDLGVWETSLGVAVVALWLLLGLYPMLFIGPIEKSLVAIGLSGFGPAGLP